jgi:hypothetical protein
VATEGGGGAVWKKEEEEDWMRWVAGLEEESEIEDYVTIGRKEIYEQDKEENLVCECDERLEKECDGDERKSEEWRAAVVTRGTIGAQAI